MEKNDLIPIPLRCVVIGGSAGSLRVVLQLIPDLRNDLDFPIIIVLHRKHDKRSSLETLLAGRTLLPVKEAEDKEPLYNGRIYIAPPDYHLLVEKDATLALDGSEKVLWSRPSIDVTFESVADVYGKDTLAVLLSGANNDGTYGLERIQMAGGKTLVQDPADAEIPVMPGAALQKIKPDYLLPGEAIAAAINRF